MKKQVIPFLMAAGTEIERWNFTGYRSLQAFLSLCPHKAMAIGIFVPGLAAALQVQAGGMEGGNGWRGSECARVQTSLQGGSLEHRCILQWLQLTPEIIWEVETESLHYNSWQC